ncbi:MAG TPA: metallophosphoesterase [Gemmataceae bacterium]|nr:metallophosphoesterase [Gemmataceae bacterium]
MTPRMTRTDENRVAIGPAKVRLAGMADLHCTKASQGALQSMFSHLSERADVLLLCGDLTDHGLPEEARVLAKELTAAVRIPMVGVLGNHDFESGQQKELTDILCAAGVHLLDGETFEVMGVGFAGVKGFAGGFDRRALEPWGEEIIKHFVREAIEEAVKLGSALARLQMPNRVALLHYSPIRATVEGEPLEIFPFLGSSRLEEPLNRCPVSAIFHGHAHHGTAEGKTSRNIPVYNVSIRLLQQKYPDQPPYHVVDLPFDPPLDSRKGQSPGDQP